MKLSDQAKRVLASMNPDEHIALETLRDAMILERHTPGILRSTEWETLWEVACREAYKLALTDFVNHIKRLPYSRNSDEFRENN